MEKRQAMDNKQKEYLVENKWIVTVKGASFIKFGGLLWLAKQLGLDGVHSKPILVDYDNNRFVYEATVTGSQGTYIIEGEANTQNTNRMMLPYIRTLASTRSVVRALRLYTGVGMTSYEECNFDVDSVADLPPQKKQARPKRKNPVKSTSASGSFDARKYKPLIEFLEANKHKDFDKNKYDKDGKHTPILFLERYYEMKQDSKFYISNWTKEQTDVFLNKLKEGTIKIDGLLVC